MCRWFSYISVNPILLDDVLIRPPHAITKQITHVQGKLIVNADGFGITWYTDARSDMNPNNGSQPSLSEVSLDDKPTPGGQVGAQVGISPHTLDGPLSLFVQGPHPAMYKTTIAKPLNDPSFISLCANISSKCIFAHLRAAADPPVVTTNNHPFVFGRHCFMHNGGITNFRDIRKEMLTHVSDEFAPMIEGGTDTEHLAAIYISKLCKSVDYGGAENHYPATKMWKALEYAIRTVENIQNHRNMRSDNSLNICVTDGESLVALCYRSDPDSPPPTLWISARIADVLNRKYGLSHGVPSEGTRPVDDIDNAASGLQQDTNAIQRDQNSEHIGQLFWTLLCNNALMSHSSTGINEGLQQDLDEERQRSSSRHGPHVIISSEKTTDGPGWYELKNRDGMLVESDGSEVKIRPETMQREDPVFVQAD